VVSEEMVERAAMAMANAVRKHPNTEGYWNWLHEDERKKAREFARCGLTAALQGGG